MTQWLYWVKRKYARTKLDCCLSLGWGDGSLELHSLSMGLCNLFDAHDLSGESIRMAKGLCEKLGYKDRINYQVTDINTIELEASKYDIVFACISLHHIAELEHVLGQIRKSLKPGGYFIFNEYVGLSQFQWTDKQL